MTEISNERLAEHLSVGGWDSKMSLTPSETNSALLELLSLRNAQSEAVAVKAEQLREQGVEVLRRLSTAKVSLSDASFIAGWVTDARKALTHPAPPLAVATAPKTGIEVTGFYRKCSADTPGAEWGEGIGYYIHDEQARIEGQAEAGLTAQPPAVTDEMVERAAIAITTEQATNRSAFPDNRDLARAALTAALEAKQ